MTADGDSTVGRRSLLAASGAVGLAALAGCTSEDAPDAANETRTPPKRPAGSVDDEYWRYILDSIEYQNAVLQQLAERDG